MPSGLLARVPWKSAAQAAGAALALAGLTWLAAGRPNLAEIRQFCETVAGWCASNPAIFVAALAVLPYCGMPVTFLYVAAGSVYGPKMGLLWTALGLALNFPLGYFIGKHWLRGWLEIWLTKRGLRLPEVPPGELGKLTVLTRIIPGPPLVAQNFLLAMAGVPFGQYMLYSVPLQLLFAAGIITAGGALMKGNTKLAVTGVCLVIALGLLAHVVKTMHTAKQKNGKWKMENGKK